jgi:DNA-binding transcriptional ArsR family regulator
LKPYEDITDPALAKALAHPLRTRVLSALEGRTASPSELATELEAPLGVLSYHIRRLTALGFVKLVKSVPRRGAIEHYYTAVTRPRITDATWAATPSIVKQATVAPRLEQIGAEASAALAGGGFDAAETHLTRSPLTVDEKGWKQLATKLEALTADIQRIEADSIKRLQRTGHEGEQEVSVVLMLFHRVEPVSQPASRSGARRPRADRRART